MGEINQHEENKISISNFSIDHILNRAGQKTCEASGARPEHFRREELVNFSRINPFEGNDFHQFTFQWLNCTRYHPPKLPRGQKKEVSKRQPGRHPRIPFTVLQIETLEGSYKSSPYLCPDEITKLSGLLDLSDARIKIWFQNRRAREKREKDGEYVFKNNS